MHMYPSSQQDVWKRLTLENKANKLTSKTLPNVIGREQSEQNSEEGDLQLNDNFNKLYPIKTYSAQHDDLELGERIYESPPSFAKQKNHFPQSYTDKPFSIELMDDNQVLSKANSNSYMKKVVLSIVKQKIGKLMPILSQFRASIIKINGELEVYKNKLIENSRQNQIDLCNFIQILKKSNLDLAETNNQQKERLENIIKIKDERIASLTASLDELKNENMEMNEKLFDMNQKVIQSDLQVQQKVKQILERRQRKQEYKFEIPRLEGQVFDISHIKHESKQPTSRQSSRQVPQGEDSRIFLEIPEEDPDIRDTYGDDAYGTQSNQVQQQKLFQHVNKTQKQKDSYNSQELKFYKPCTLVTKIPTPTNKPTVYASSLTRIKSHESPFIPLSKNPSQNYLKSHKYGTNPMSRVHSGFFEKVGSPKANSSPGGKGFSNNRSSANLVGKSGYQAWKQERSKAGSKYGNINASLSVNRADESCASNEEKLNKLGSRIEQLRKQIKRQIHGCN